VVEHEFALRVVAGIQRQRAEQTLAVQREQVLRIPAVALQAAVPFEPGKEFVPQERIFGAGERVPRVGGKLVEGGDDFYAPDGGDPRVPLRASGRGGR
jgi:hypothetical protein